MWLTTLGSVVPYVANGSVRILAVMQPQRFAGAPDIPTIAETLPHFRAALSWFGLFGPPGLPRPIIDRLSTEIGKAARSPEIEQKIKTLDLNVFWT
jgi:tripartite-type tricarboxylate transporter receptor subunit TctC